MDGLSRDHRVKCRDTLVITGQPRAERRYKRRASGRAVMGFAAHDCEIKCALASAQFATKRLVQTLDWEGDSVNQVLRAS